MHTTETKQNVPITDMKERLSDILMVLSWREIAKNYFVKILIMALPQNGWYQWERYAWGIYIERSRNDEECPHRPYCEN